MRGTEGRSGLKSVYSFLGMKSSPDIEFIEIFSGKPDTANVLVQLVQDKSNSPRVRKRAIGCLMSGIRPDNMDEFAQLCVTLMANEEEDADLRIGAAFIAMNMAATQAGKRLEVGSLLGSSDPTTNFLASAVLWAQREKRDIAGPVLVTAIERLGPSNWLAMESFSSTCDDDGVPFLLKFTHNRVHAFPAILGLQRWIANCRPDPDDELVKTVLARFSEVAASDAHADVRKRPRRHWMARSALCRTSDFRLPYNNQ